MERYALATSVQDKCTRWNREYAGYALARDHEERQVHTIRADGATARQCTCWNRRIRRIRARTTRSQVHTRDHEERSDRCTRNRSRPRTDTRPRGATGAHVGTDTRPRVHTLEPPPHPQGAKRPTRSETRCTHARGHEDEATRPRGTRATGAHVGRKGGHASYARTWRLAG